MTPEAFPDEAQLRARLLARLSGFGPNRAGGLKPRGFQLSTYAARERERLEAVRMPQPVIGVVLRGLKEVWIGASGERLAAGTVFVLPRDVRLDVVNCPDPDLGLYESLMFEVPALPPGVGPLGPAERRMPVRPDRPFSVPLTDDLVEAVAHAASGLSGNGPDRQAIGTFRLAELLTLLRAAPAARPLFDTTLGERLAWLVRSDPSRPWSVARAAAELGLGASTLRRRLAVEGRAFRDVLATVRMDCAREVLAAGAGSTAAAEAAGYSSRSHFARRYRRVFGTSPAGRP